ncbi:Putative vitellogenin receptor [Eumeta japonica]|uniref:Vitellogenin receptor n=1 Tax=Eumeta variegata TaxID=151549 RepID=A0A4C1WUQ3_EUMVA|nr:Putative vitellogenin receptor [Eumeta japonica]
MCIDAGCDGRCRPSSRGPVCACDTMLRYVNGSCVDIDECVEENVQCSQHCTNLYRGFRCSCDAGYVSDFAEYLCFAKDGEGLVFLTLRNEIRYYKLKSREEVVLAADAKQARGVTSDGTWVYWVETAQGHQAVMRAELHDVSRTKQVIIALGLEDPGDIAIDWLGGQLYLTDAARGHIAVCRLTGDACAALSDGIKYPRFVTLHPQRGAVLWPTGSSGMSRLDRRSTALSQHIGVK